MIPRAFPRGLGLLPALALLVAGCDKVPLTAPTESAIQLFASASSVPVNGSVEIIATVTEQPGTPVHNGTVVTFTTTLGRIEPAEARTNNGRVTVRLVADGRSGNARVTAFSGAATQGELNILIGGAAARFLTLTAEPSSVPQTGGTVTLTALVRDGGGNALASVPVSFSSTSGQFIGGNVAQTDAAGRARTQLSVNREATVTATVDSVADGEGGGPTPLTAEVTITVSALPSISLTSSTPTPTAGLPVAFSVTVTPSSSGAPIQNVRIDFGDGDSRSLGTLSGTTSVSHVYSSQGSYTVTVTATDTTGQTAQLSTVVVVAPRAPIGVNLTASPAAPTINQVVTFTATATVGAGVLIDRYQWSFGDGSSRITSGNQTTHIYTQSGTKVVTVQVFTVDGATGAAQIEVAIAPAP